MWMSQNVTLYIILEIGPALRATISSVSRAGVLSVAGILTLI